MISIWMALLIAVIAAGLGIWMMALLAAGGQADECAKCELKKWKEDNDRG